MLSMVNIVKVLRAPRTIFANVNVDMLTLLRTVTRCLVHCRLRAPRGVVTVVVKHPRDFVSNFGVWHERSNTAMLK